MSKVDLFVHTSLPKIGHFTCILGGCPVSYVSFMKSISLKNICILLQGINLFQNCSWIHIFFSKSHIVKVMFSPCAPRKNLSRPIFQLSTIAIIEKSYHGGAQSTVVCYHIISILVSIRNMGNNCTSDLVKRRRVSENGENTKSYRGGRLQLRSEELSTRKICRAVIKRVGQ